jgi:methionine salvage enolase-phosphatase E1
VKILDRLGISAGEVLFIDDKEANTAAAANVGIVTETFTPSAGTRPVSELRRVLKKYGLM